MARWAGHAEWERGREEARVMRAQWVVKDRGGERGVPGATVPRGGEEGGGCTRAGVCGREGAKSGGR